MTFLSGLLKGAAGFATGGLGGLALGLGSELLGHGGNKGMSNAAGQYGAYAPADRNRFLTALQGGPQAVQQTTQAAVQDALPSYLKNLQGMRENAIRRGASLGDLQTSNEGDLASAFQRNIANAAAGQAANVWGQQTQGYGNLANQSGNTYLDLLAGNRDYNQGQQNNIFGLLGAGIGAYGNYKAAQAGWGG